MAQISVDDIEDLWRKDAFVIDLKLSYKTLSERGKYDSNMN